MAITNMQFGQSAINVVLNEGQLPAKISTDANGNTVLVGEGGNIPIAGNYAFAHTEGDIQRLLDLGVPVALAGDTTITKGISLGTAAKLNLNGFTLSAGGLHNFNLITTSNAVWNGDTGLDGVALLCADEGQTGNGTLTRVAGSPATLTWAAAGDTAGAAVDVSGADGKYTLASNNGKRLYVVVVNSRLPASGAKSVTVNATTGAKAMTWSRASNVLTITEVGHGRAGGDPVTLFGANVAGVFFIDRVTGVDTYVIGHDSRTNGSGAGSVFGVRDITYENGVQDANYSGHTTTPNNFTTIGGVFHSVAGLKLRHLRGIDTQKYCFYLTHASGWDIENIEFNSNSDGVHISSPARPGNIKNLRGKTNDNMLAYGVADYKEYVLHWPTEPGNHDCIGGSFEGIFAEECFNTVRFYGSGTWYVGGITGKAIYGVVTTPAGISIKGDSGVVGASAQQNARDIHLEDISLRYNTGGAFQVLVCDMVGDVRGVSIDNFDVSEPPVASGSIQFNTPIKDVTISNPRSPGFFTAGVAREWSGSSVVCLSNTATIETLRLRGFKRFKTSNGVTTNPYIVYNVNTANSITNLLLEDLDVEHVSTTGNRLCLVRNNGILKKFVLEHATLSGAEIFRQPFASAQAGNVVELRDVHAVKGANTGALYLVPIDGANPGEVRADGVTGDATELYRCGNNNVQNVNLRLSRIASAINPLAVPVTGPVFRAYAPDVAITLSMLDRATPGQMCIARTALGTIPINTLAVNDGTGAANSWKAVHNTTLVY